MRLLSDRLVLEGHSVTVISGVSSTQAVDFPADEDGRAGEIRSVILPRMGREVRIVDDMLTLFSLIREIKKGRPDIVSGHSSKSGLLAALACKLCGVPYLYTAHSWAFLQSPSRFANWSYRWLWRLAKGYLGHIICVSHYDREIAVSSGIASIGRVSVIHNGLHERSLNPQKTKKTEQENTRIVSIARLSPPKDFRCLIEAVGLDNNLALDIFGDGPDRESLEEFTEILGLSAQVSFRGEIRQASEWVAHYDILALSSRSEGLPYALLEGMRAGIPIVASNVGGVSEVVSDGETGFLVEAGNSHLFSEKLSHLSDDPDLRSRMGHASRKKFLKQFQFREMFWKTEHIYQYIIRESLISGNEERPLR